MIWRYWDFLVDPQKNILPFYKISILFITYKHNKVLEELENWKKKIVWLYDCMLYDFSFFEMKSPYNHQSSLISPRLHSYLPPRFLNIASSNPEWFNEFSTPTSNKLFDGLFDPSRLSKNLNLMNKIINCGFPCINS